MNEDMLQMARKAGFSDHSNPEMWGYMIASVEELTRFAALVRADEREACAKVCESFIPKHERFDDQRVAGNKSRAIAAAIRERKS
jgi:hypothetical protein